MVIEAIVIGAILLIAVSAWRIRRYWRMWDDPKFAVRQARRESERLAERPFSDRGNDDAWGHRW